MPGEKLNITDISIGKALPWDVCDSNGILLLQKGTIINSQKQLDGLLQRGIYKQHNNMTNQRTLATYDEKQPKTSPFIVFQDYMEKLGHLFSCIILRHEDCAHKLEKFCREFHAFCTENTDALLGCVHLCHNNPYTICHPLHVAALSQIISYRQGYREEKIHSIIAAALLCNISKLELQETLHHQIEPLTDDQACGIKSHPELSAKILKEAGVNDHLCISIVKQHHERPDGSGYPNNLGKEQLVKESQIVNIADRYSAMVSTRNYRKPMTSKETLQEFFLKKEEEFDETLILAFIKELSIFPPGTFVKLKNGEIAIVIKRGIKTMWPCVASIMGPGEKLYASPLRRDCNNTEHAIEDVYNLKKIPPLNLNRVWGYI